MSLVSEQYRYSFEKVRRRNAVTRREFRALFCKDVNDEWPLQARFAELSFLDGLSPEERDAEIAAYALECYADILGASRQVGNTTPYLCCLTFYEDDWKNMLWPHILFANNKIQRFRNIELESHSCSFSEYVESLVSRKVAKRADYVLLQEYRKDLSEAKVYVERVRTVDDPRVLLGEIVQ